MAEADSSSFALRWYKTFDAGHDTRDSKTRLATLALDGFSFIPLATAERKGVFRKVVRICYTHPLLFALGGFRQTRQVPAPDVGPNQP